MCNIKAYVFVCNVAIAYAVVCNVAKEYDDVWNIALNTTI